ncbi:hypothetical protein GCM10009665_17300 [Kitasatospora nipponensis]|uniref:Uncharacterized protein n=1 Tax=Kitasatospora nipponensis TaxID=258049 RepID=A0ABN1W1G5_9ACTN
MLLLLPSLDERLSEDHLARFVAELVDEVLERLGQHLVARRVDRHVVLERPDRPELPAAVEIAAAGLWSVGGRG